MIYTIVLAVYYMMTDCQDKTRNMENMKSKLGSSKYGEGCSRKLEKMATTLESSKKDKATQCAIFLHTIGEEALDLNDTFTFNGTKRDKIAYSEIQGHKTKEQARFTRSFRNG